MEAITPALGEGMPGAMPAGLRQRLAELFPGALLAEVAPLRPDASSFTGATAKALGYGTPLRIRLRHAGEDLTVVFRTAASNRYGHDRRADRAAAILLDFDTFDRIPGHVLPLDVGAIGADGALLSLKDAG